MIKATYKKGIVYLLTLVLALSFAAVAAAADAPALMLTRIVPDTDNVNSTETGKGIDAYELIEVYNNSGKEIKTKGYNIVYAYSDDLNDAKNQIWSLGDKTIPAGGFLYVWVKQKDNPQKVSDFVEYWGKKFKEDQVLIVEAGGMANGSRRVMAVVDPSNKEISRSIYNDKDVDVELNKTNVYGLPTDGGKTLKVMATKQEPEFGKLLPGQVSAPAKADDKAASKPAAPAPSKTADNAAATPSAMPKTGMGGASQTEGSNMLMWALGALAVAGLASTFVIRKKANQN